MQLSFSGIAFSINYSESMFVAVGIQHEIRMPHIVIWGLFGYTNFSSLSHERYVRKKKPFVI